MEIQDDRLAFASQLMDLVELNKTVRDELGRLITELNADPQVTSLLTSTSNVLDVQRQLLVILHEWNLQLEDELDEIDSQNVCPKNPGGKIPQNKGRAIVKNYFEKAKKHVVDNRKIYTQVAATVTAAVVVTALVRKMNITAVVPAASTVVGNDSISGIITLFPEDIDDLAAGQPSDIVGFAESVGFEAAILSRTAYDNLVNFAHNAISPELANIS